MYQDNLPNGSDLDLEPPEHEEKMKNFIKFISLFTPGELSSF
jgi:hypothetical protein